MNLTFHQTFPLERENLAKVLLCFSNNPAMGNAEIAERTGIGIGKDPNKGKVLPTIKYAVFGGLVSEEAADDTRMVRLTPAGAQAFRHDPALKSPVSQWLIHYNLSRVGGEAAAWAWFVHTFLPRRDGFARADLEHGLLEAFGAQAKVRSINPGVLLTTYRETSALGGLRLLREKDGRYVRTRPYIPNGCIVAYVLADLWEATHPERIMIGPEALSGAGNLASVFGLGEDAVREYTDEMESLGVLRQLREAPPYQLVRQWDDPIGLLDRAYQES